MNGGPHPFVLRAIKDIDEETGLQSSASRIQEFYAARAKGADAEISWLASYFGFAGMEQSADSNIILEIIERELLTGCLELISCSECGRLYDYGSGFGGVPRVLCPEPQPPSEPYCGLLSHDEARQQAANGMHEKE